MGGFLGARLGPDIMFGSEHLTIQIPNIYFNIKQGRKQPMLRLEVPLATQEFAISKSNTCLEYCHLQ